MMAPSNGFLFVLALLSVQVVAKAGNQQDVEVPENYSDQVEVGDTVAVDYIPELKIDPNGILADTVCLYVKVIHKSNNSLATDREFDFYKTPNVLCWEKGEKAMKKTYKVIALPASINHTYSILGQVETKDGATTVPEKKKLEKLTMTAEELDELPTAGEKEMENLKQKYEQKNKVYNFGPTNEKFLFEDRFKMTFTVKQKSYL
eukprot:g7801.t1